MIEPRRRKHGPVYRVRRLEGRLTATFRNREAAELQDALWGRWGEAIPVLADSPPKVAPELLARLVSPQTTELSPALLMQLLAKHPVRQLEGAVEPTRETPLLGEYIATFLPLWEEDRLPGRTPHPKSAKNTELITDALNRLIYELDYVRDERGWRVKDKDGNHLARGWGERALAWQPLDEVTAKMILALDRDVKEAGVGMEVWRKVLNFLQQLFDYALIEEQVASNPILLVKKPPQRTSKKVRKPFLPEVVEGIRTDFLLLDEIAATRVRGRKVANTPAGVPVPTIPGYGRWSADLVEALAYGGFRPGEAFAARAEDLEGDYLAVVRRSVDGVAANGTKSTAYPAKEVYLLGPLPQTFMRRADDVRSRYLFAFPGTNRLVTEGEYRRWRTRYYTPIARRHGLGPESDDPYALRHVYASLRVAAGHPVPHIEASMGTSLVTKTYASVFRKFEGKEPLDIDEAIRVAREAAMKNMLASAH